MGGARAAQLSSEGMRGIGRVFRLFRRRQLTDPDEVYVLYAPAALRYRSLTLPLVNVRYTLRAMRQAGHVRRAEERHERASQKRLERWITWPSIFCVTWGELTPLPLASDSSG